MVKIQMFNRLSHLDTPSPIFKKIHLALCVQYWNSYCGHYLYENHMYYFVLQNMLFFFFFTCMFMALLKVGE